MNGIDEKIFLRNPNCRAVIISKRPLMGEGLQSVMLSQSDKSSVTILNEFLALTPEMLEHADVVLFELDCSLPEIFEQCGAINALQNRYRHVHWVFLISVQFFNIAIERLLTLKTSLLSLHETMSTIIEHVYNSNGDLEKISPLLLQEKAVQPPVNDVAKTTLSFSERRVLRLISKGWQLTQIATLLEKTIKP